MSQAPAVITNPTLMKKQRLAVAAEGELVVMHLGNVEVKLPYETALLLSQWLRVRAKQAKRFAGDTSRHWSAVGVITDANETRG